MSVQIPVAEHIDVNLLKVDSENPNVMTKQEHERLASSIKKFGFIVPIITNRDLLIADGEQRWTVAKSLGMKQVPVIRLDVEDVDRRLLRQVLNKLRGEHELVADALEFEKIISLGREADLKHLLDLNDRQLETYLTMQDNPNLRVTILNNEPQSISLLPYRPITSYGENIYHVSASEYSHKKRDDAIEIIKKDQEHVPTLQGRGWWFHEDINGREFSLREYAQVQDFPDSFIFVGSINAIRKQIGNAVSPKMAEYIAKKIPPSNAVSLFSGCGGMDLGFQKVEHKVLLASDWEPICAYTHKANFPNIPFILKDVHKITAKEILEQTQQKIDLIFGGPPCQGFSMSGLRFKNDPRNQLYKEFLRIIEELDTQYFVMENVMGILSYKDQIIEDMELLGFQVELRVVKGEDIGMRQKRHRVFFIGKKAVKTGENNVPTNSNTTNN